MSKHIPGPVETLARLALRSDRYTTDEEFRIAVDAVLGNPVYDAAPDTLEAFKRYSKEVDLFAAREDLPYGSKRFLSSLYITARAAITKAEGQS